MPDIYDNPERRPLARALFWWGYLTMILFFLALLFWGPLFI